MNKRLPLSMPILSSLLLIGCASSDDRGAAAGRAVVNTIAATGAVVADALVYGKCLEINAGAAREACQSRTRDAQIANAAISKAEPRAKFDDLETYKAKRDAEVAKGE